MQRKILHFLNKILNICIVFAVAVTVLYCVYSIWDNDSIYAAEESFMADIRELKPKDEEKPSFDDLLKVNPDVCGWVTLEGTNIDTPIVQGKDNAEYLNKSVYGTFALSGCPYLDTRNSRDFTDPYSIVYGHHMDRHQMFGDLDLYLESSFFEQHTTGVLLTPGERHPLTSLAVLSIDAADPGIYEPEQWITGTDGSRDNAEERFAYIREHSLFTNDAALAAAESDGSRLLALSTCSGEDEDLRTVVVLAYS